MSNSTILPTLSVEMAYLALACALLIVHVTAQATLLTVQLGIRYNAGPRDQSRPLAGIAARADRALRNFLETFPLFVALVLAVTVAGKADTWTATGAALYFWARVAYLPLYLAGIRYLRSIVWAIAGAGLVIILWQLAF